MASKRDQYETKVVHSPAQVKKLLRRGWEVQSSQSGMLGMAPTHVLRRPNPAYVDPADQPVSPRAQAREDAFNAAYLERANRKQERRRQRSERKAQRDQSQPGRNESPDQSRPAEALPPPVAPANWYPDPRGEPGLLRYWDGTAWTDHTHQQ